MGEIHEYGTETTSYHSSINPTLDDGVWSSRGSATSGGESASFWDNEGEGDSYTGTSTLVDDEWQVVRSGQSSADGARNCSM